MKGVVGGGGGMKGVVGGGGGKGAIADDIDKRWSGVLEPVGKAGGRGGMFGKGGGGDGTQSQDSRFEDFVCSNENQHQNMNRMNGSEKI